VYNLDGSVSYEDYGVGTAVERTRKEVPNISQYTFVPEDFTDRYLDFTANGGETIQGILNAGVMPDNGELRVVQSGNNKLTYTAGTGTVLFTKPDGATLTTVPYGWSGMVKATAADTYSVNGSLESNVVAGLDVRASNLAGDLSTAEKDGIKTKLSIVDGSSSLNWINVLDYGADPTGVVSSTTAFINAQSAITGNAGVIYIPEGDYLFSSEFNVTKRITFIGEGSGKNYGWFSNSKIIGKTNINLWRISAAGVSISDIGFEWQGALAPTSAIGLYVANTDTDVSPNMNPQDVSQKLHLTNVSARGFYDNIYIYDCATWVFDKLTSVAPIRYALYVSNHTFPDAGDWSISNSMFFQPTSTPRGIALYHASSGGGKIVNTKFNGSFNHDIYCDLNFSTVILQVSNCSFENFVAGAIYCEDMVSPIIVGCEFAPYKQITGAAILEFKNTKAGVISSNSFLGNNFTSNKAIKVSNSNHTAILGNAYYQFPSSDPTVFVNNTDLFYDRGIVAPIPRSANFSVALTDHKKDNYCSAALVVNVPTNASIPIDVGFESHYWQTGTGAVTFTGASGVTINKDASELLEIASQYNAVTLKKIATDSWILIGGLKKTP